MESYKATLANELFRMYRRKKAVLVVILSVGIIAAVQLLSLILRSGLGILGGTGTGFPVTVLSIVSGTLLPLFVTLAVIDTFTGEYAADTMKITITKPVTRLRIYLAKLSAVGVFVLINLGIVLVLSLLLTILFHARSLSLAWFFNVILAYAATFFPIMTLAVVVAYPACVLKGGAAVFFLSILAYLVFQGLGLVFPSLSGILVTSLLDWYKLWTASRLPVGSIVRSLSVMLAYLLIFFALGFRRFDRRDL